MSLTGHRAASPFGRLCTSQLSELLPAVHLLAPCPGVKGESRFSPHPLSLPIVIYQGEQQEELRDVVIPGLQGSLLSRPAEEQAQKANLILELSGTQKS